MLKLIASLAAIRIRAILHGQWNPHDPLCPAHRDPETRCYCAGVGRLCTCGPTEPYLRHHCPVHR